MAAVAVVCRGVKLHVARHVLHRAPLLLNACSDEPQEIEEEVNLDRDPAAVRMVLEYCQTGIITPEMITDDFFAEADYFGIAPLRPLLQPTREAESYEELFLSASIFVERLINTNILRQLEEFSDTQKAGSADPAFTLLVKCELYEPCDIWRHYADAYRYAVAHPEILRTAAFTCFGASITWDVKPVNLDDKRKEGDTDDGYRIATHGLRPIYNEQSWELEPEEAPDSLPVTPADRFGYKAPVTSSSYVPCVSGVIGV
jgi:hypothetical protein